MAVNALFKALLAFVNLHGVYDQLLFEASHATAPALAGVHRPVTADGAKMWSCGWRDGLVAVYPAPAQSPVASPTN